MLSKLNGHEPRRIGEYLSVPPSAIEWAVSVQRAELECGNVIPLGEILLEREQISYNDLLSALKLQRLDRLRQCTLFAQLSDPDLATISLKSEEVALATGQALLRQDERGDSIYALLSGRLLIYRREGNRDGLPVGVAVPGDFLGETDYLSHGTRSITACAIEPTILLKTRYEYLRECASFSLGPPLGSDQNPFSLPDTKPESSNAEVPPVSETTADALMAYIARRAGRVMHADRAHLFLINPEANDLYTRVVMGEEKRTFRVPVGAEIAGRIARTGDLVNLQEAYLDAQFSPAIDIWTGHWTRTLMAGPVRDAAGAIIGVIQVINKNRGFFTQDDEVLFRAFAHQAAEAITSCLPTLNSPAPMHAATSSAG